MTRPAGYVHGYDAREGDRLRDQAGTLADLLHHDTVYPAGSAVLEAGCGVGAQTVELARRSPDARFTSIDRRLYPLVVEAGFGDVAVSPRNVYVDASRPALVDGFTRRTFTAMVAGARDAAVEAGLIAAERFDAGLRDLERTTEPDGVFTYTFFKAVARVPPAGQAGGAPV